MKVYPRAIEILVGILVNMASLSVQISLKLVKQHSLINFLFFEIIGQMTDVPSVIQTIRLFTMFFTTDTEKQIFLAFLNSKNNVHESDEQADAESLNWSGLILDNFLFILEQSLNPNLLDTAISFLLNLSNKKS